MVVDLCVSTDRGRCNKGAKCTFAHGREELRRAEKRRDSRLGINGFGDFCQRFFFLDKEVVMFAISCSLSFLSFLITFGLLFKDLSFFGSCLYFFLLGMV